MLLDYILWITSKYLTGTSGFKSIPHKTQMCRHEENHLGSDMIWHMISSGEQEWTFEWDSEEARVCGRIALTLSNTAQTCLHIGDLKQCMKAETQVLTRPVNQARFVCIAHSDLFSWEITLQMETGNSTWEANKCWSLGDALFFLDMSLLHFMRTSYQWVKDIPSLFLALVSWLVYLNKTQQIKAL